MVLIISLICSSVSVADNYKTVDDNFSEQQGLIEIEYSPEITYPYNERRGSWSTIIALNQENFYPDKLRTSDGTTYSQIFGKSDIKMMQAEIGVKYNFFLGSLYASIIGSTGKVIEPTDSNQATLSIVKRSGSVGLILDNFFKEPYVAPYASIQALNFQYNYNDPITSFSASDTTGITTAVTAGVLLQLNAIDLTNAAETANHEWGLDNTYLDIFISQYGSTATKESPDFQTSFNYGAGIKLEF